MPSATVLGGSKTANVKLDDKVFGARFNEGLVHSTVLAEQAARRRGTAATLTRGGVSGGGAKPWRQKGTGRARAGSNRSPIWKGGGIVFGPQPRSYTFKINRKERRAALRSALSLHAGRGSVAVLEPNAIDQPKTRLAVDLLEAWGQDSPTLVVLGTEESAAALAFRNLPRVAVLHSDDVGVADLLRAASLLISRPALDALTARVGSAPRRGAEAPAEAPAATKAKAPAKAKAKAEAPAEEQA